jgi:hypothetical protein
MAGTRNLSDNLSDLKAQVAANYRGIALVADLIREYSLPTVQAYMHYIQVRTSTTAFSILQGFYGVVCSLGSYHSLYVLLYRVLSGMRIVGQGMVPRGIKQSFLAAVTSMAWKRGIIGVLSRVCWRKGSPEIHNGLGCFLPPCQL